MRDGATGQLEAYPSALVLSSAIGANDRAPSLYFSGSGSRVLVITYVRSPRQWVEDWRAVHGDLPDAIVILAPDTWLSYTPPPNVTIETITDPGDLTGQMIGIFRHLDSWADADIVVCLDSLTVLFQFAEFQSIYRFLHHLRTGLAQSSVRFLFDLDPDTVTGQNLLTLTSTVDAVARRHDDHWEIRAR